MRQLLAKGGLCMCKMPIGVENFRELMEGNYYFVDKTLFIQTAVKPLASAMGIEFNVDSLVLVYLK